ACGDDPGREVLVFEFDHGNPYHPHALPHRRGRLLEHFSLAALRAGVVEIRLCQIRRAGPPHNGDAERRAALQPAPHADRRRRSSCQMVLPAETGASRCSANRQRVSTSDEWISDAEMEKLKKSKGLTGNDTEQFGFVAP